MATWHGMVGPGEFILPDEEDSISDLVATQLGVGVGTYLANRYATYLDYRLVRHQATGNLVRREIMRQGVRRGGQATLWRGATLVAVSNPFVGWITAFLLLGASLPPSGRSGVHHEQTVGYWTTGSGYDPALVGV